MLGFEYRPTVSLKEGFDAIAEWQRMKLQKGLAKIQLGSQFGDKSALVEGFGELGLEETAKRYAEPDIKDKLKEGAVNAALAEYFSNPNYGAGTSVPNITETQLASDKQVNAPNQKGKPVDKNLAEVTKGYRNEMATGIVKQAKENLKNMPGSSLNKFENIEKYVVSAPTMADSKARLMQVLDQYITKEGGLDIGTMLKFQQLDEALATTYGREYRSSINWSSLLKQRQGGSGAGGKDYTVMDNSGKIIGTYRASTPSEALKYANVKQNQGLVVKGTADKVIDVTNKIVQDYMSTPNKLQSAGIIYKKPLIFGNPHYEDATTGEELTQAEVQNRILKTALQRGDVQGIDAINMQNADKALKVYENIKRNIKK